jgi:hypothetical protein
LGIIEKAKRSFRWPAAPLKHTNEALLAHGLIKDADAVKGSSSSWTNLFATDGSSNISETVSTGAKVEKGFK